MSRVKHHIKALQKQHEQLRQQILSLERNKRALLIRQGILASWCEVFNMMQSATAVQLTEDQQVDAEQFQALLQEEVALLQQLSASGAGPQQPDAMPLAALVVQQPGVQTIAPCTDPMAYVRGLLLKPIVEEAATMTPEQYAALTKTDFFELSIQVHKLNCCSDSADRLKDIADCWDRVYHCSISLVLLGRHDTLQEGCNYNFETMQPDSKAWQQQEQQAPELVSAMDLSEQQQELIAVGFRLFLDLQQSIQQEHQDLHAQMAALDVGAGAAVDSNTNTDAAGNTCCTHSSSISGSSSSNRTPTDKSALARLEKQEALGGRLKPLLFKVYRLHLAAVGLTIGCLTYEQLSRAAVMSWPYTVRLLFLGAEVMKQREALRLGQ